MVHLLSVWMQLDIGADWKEKNYEMSKIIVVLFRTVEIALPELLMSSDCHKFKVLFTLWFQVVQRWSLKWTWQKSLFYPSYPYLHSSETVWLSWPLWQETSKSLGRDTFRVHSVWCKSEQKYLKAGIFSYSVWWIHIAAKLNSREGLKRQKIIKQ